MELGPGKIPLILLVAVLYFVVPIALVSSVLYWLFSKTRMGKNLLNRTPDAGASRQTQQVTDQLQAFQVQLDDVHSRLDFAERVILEQREQLRALGAPEHQSELRQATPV